MPGYGRRYWAERTGDSRRKRYPKFRGQHTADAVVIGGGLTGATCAYVLAAGGLDVVLLEADRPASGATAGGTGVLVPVPDAAFRTVEERSGRRVARTAWKEARRSAKEFATALRKISARCDLDHAPLVVNARGAEDAQALRREQAARRDAGVPAPWLPAPSAVAEIGTDSAGALIERDAFVYDPVRAALALAAAAASNGARIFERSAVSRTRFTRKHADVILPAGAIRTRGVIVATGEPGAVFRQLRRHVRQATGYAVVTEPWSAAMRKEAGRRSAILTEAGVDPHWMRWLADDRVLFAGAVSAPVGSRQRDKSVIQRTGQLMYELSVRYPAISGLPAKWAWDVPVATTEDGLPWIGPHRNYPFHFFALAFGWHGDALAWLAAKSALRFLRGEARREDEAFGFLRHV